MKLKKKIKINEILSLELELFSSILLKETEVNFYLDKKIAELKQEIEKQKKFPLNWENCFQKQGFYINNTSEIIEIDVKENYNENNKNVNNKNIFRAEKEAKSALVMAQLSHIIWVANGCEELDWDVGKDKYVITNNKNSTLKTTSYRNYYFLSFKTAEIRDKVYEENKQLIRDYLMII